MTRCAVFVSCVGAFCLGITTTASAEPVKITGGSLVFETGERFQLGSISLVGTRGFSVEGHISSEESEFPALNCIPCTPGITLNLGADIFGPSFFGGTDMTLDGETFTDIGDPFSPVTPFLDLAGTMTVPELQNSPIVAIAPFTLIGAFRTSDPNLPQKEVPIRGSGRVSIILAPSTSGLWWDVRGLRYDFASTPTPEPATLTLVAGGLVAAAIRARKRRDRRTTIQLSMSRPMA